MAKTVSLTLPQTIPVSEDGKTKLTISINAAFSDAPGSYTVQTLLEEETGWQGGESPRISLDTERGELVSVTLNVFYMTELDASTRSIYAQGNVDASAPFSYDVPLGYTTPSVQIEQMGQAATLHYTLPDGSTPVLSLRLPQNMAAVAGEDLQILLTQTGEAVGSVNLYPFGATDEQALQQIDSAVNALPMQIFSTIALSNHAGYDGYQVRQYSSTGAVATAKFIWQDLSSGSAAASIPWQEQDCVLVYDWGVMPYFVEIKLAQGLCSERELTEVAESIKLE